MRGSRPPNRRRTLRPRQPADEMCDFCEQTFIRDDQGTYIDGSCILFDIQGLPRVPHVWPDELLDDPPEGVDADTPCGFCGTPIGGYHHYGCSLEVCPWESTHPDDGHQLLCCGCLEDPRAS